MPLDYRLGYDVCSHKCHACCGSDCSPEAAEGEGRRKLIIDTQNEAERPPERCHYISLRPGLLDAGTLESLRHVSGTLLALKFTILQAEQIQMAHPLVL